MIGQPKSLNKNSGPNMYLVLLLLAFVCFAHAQFEPPGGYQPMTSGASPCQPNFQCPLRCPNGYKKDQNGCSICLCSQGSSGQNAAISNPGGDPMHQGGASIFGGAGSTVGSGSSPNYTNPCFAPLKLCPINCDYGYSTGRNGCQYCLCAHKPVQLPAEGFYTNPCLDAPVTCDADCAGGNYVTGSSGCQYCQCKATSGQPQENSSSVSSSPSPPVDCTVKVTECQLKCPFGFMTDTKDCDLCVCKDDIYAVASVPVERQPKVRLSNPCIQGFDMCMIICRSGYLQGPRSCQYCACQE